MDSHYPPPGLSLPSPFVREYWVCLEHKDGALAEGEFKRYVRKVGECEDGDFQLHISAPSTMNWVYFRLHLHFRKLLATWASAEQDWNDGPESRNYPACLYNKPSSPSLSREASSDPSNPTSTSNTKINAEQTGSEEDHDKEPDKQKDKDQQQLPITKPWPFPGFTSWNADFYVGSGTGHTGRLVVSGVKSQFNLGAIFDYFHLLSESSVHSITLTPSSRPTPTSPFSALVSFTTQTAYASFLTSMFKSNRETVDEHAVRFKGVKEYKVFEAIANYISNKIGAIACTVYEEPLNPDSNPYANVIIRMTRASRANAVKKMQPEWAGGADGKMGKAWERVRMGEAFALFEGGRKKPESVVEEVPGLYTNANANQPGMNQFADPTPPQYPGMNMGNSTPFLQNPTAFSPHQPQQAQHMGYGGATPFYGGQTPFIGGATPFPGQQQQQQQYPGQAGAMSPNSYNQSGVSYTGHLSPTSAAGMSFAHGQLQQQYGHGLLPQQMYHPQPFQSFGNVYGNPAQGDAGPSSFLPPSIGRGPRKPNVVMAGSAGRSGVAGSGPNRVPVQGQGQPRKQSHPSMDPVQAALSAPTRLPQPSSAAPLPPRPAAPNQPRPKSPTPPAPKSGAPSPPPPPTSRQQPPAESEFRNMSKFNAAKQLEMARALQEQRPINLEQARRDAERATSAAGGGAGVAGSRSPLGGLGSGVMVSPVQIQPPAPSTQRGPPPPPQSAPPAAPPTPPPQLNNPSAATAAEGAVPMDVDNVETGFGFDGAPDPQAQTASQAVQLPEPPAVPTGPAAMRNGAAPSNAKNGAGTAVKANSKYMSEEEAAVFRLSERAVSFDYLAGLDKGPTDMRNDWDSEYGKIRQHQLGFCLEKVLALQKSVVKAEEGVDPIMEESWPAPMDSYQRVEDLFQRFR